MNGTTFVILSFEGPDRYSHAGGLGSRVTELSQALAGMGFEAHLFFIGDPGLPGHERVGLGDLTLHRWCQWISRYHPGGVYDNEEGKLNDWNRSLPAWLETQLLEPKVGAGHEVVIMAEEWHTVGSMLALREIIARRGWDQQVRLLWNANNTFSFHRIDWESLKRAAAVTTVSRYMKHVLWGYGVDARVIPNGISESWLQSVTPRHSRPLSKLFQGRLSLAKVARWDPDKRWIMAVDAVADMKRRGLRPLLLARGGVEAHRHEVLGRAQAQGLTVTSVYWDRQETEALIEAVRPAVVADVVNLQGYLSAAQRRSLFHSVDAVLANSGIEPFGLVGLETMAVGGVAFVGCTGEDYATPGHDAISIQSDNPQEIVYHAVSLHDSPSLASHLRRAARQTAEHYTWRSVLQRALAPYLRETGLEVGLEQAEPSTIAPRQKWARPVIRLPSAVNVQGPGSESIPLPQLSEQTGPRGKNGSAQVGPELDKRVA